jgi:hypothetical protein
MWIAIKKEENEKTRKHIQHPVSFLFWLLKYTSQKVHGEEYFAKRRLSFHREKEASEEKEEV